MGKQPNLYSFELKKLTKLLRQYIVKIQHESFARYKDDKDKVFKVGVSGGSLPKILAQALLAPSEGPDDVIEFEKWEIFFADERAVKRDHEDSNYRLLKEELLNKIEGKQPKVHTIDESLLDNTGELAAEYAEQLVSVFARRDSVKIPTFDLLLLGCGPDGHTCSLFPGHDLLRETENWVYPIEDSPKPPARRITLSLPVVNHAHRICFVATGAGKKEVLSSVFEGGVHGDEAKGLPIALINEAAGDRVSWFVDEEAVQGVRYPRRGSL